MLKVYNFGCACAVIESESGYRILTDPWLVGAAYLGAWQREHYLPDPIAAIGRIDCVWISHLHEDHLHLESLRLLRKHHPNVPIWIGTHCKHLARLLTEFSPVIQNEWLANDIEAYVFASPDEHSEGIDSYLVVIDSNSTVVDFNDLPFHADAAHSVRCMADGSHLTALIPYTGAGPWPQCFTMTNIERWQHAEAKKAKFIAQFQQYREVLKPDVAVPFSAGYVLRGPLADLNRYRGIPDPHEIPGATVLPVIGAGERPVSTFNGYDWEPETLRLGAGDTADQGRHRAPAAEGHGQIPQGGWATTDHRDRLRAWRAVSRLHGRTGGQGARDDPD